MQGRSNKQLRYPVINVLNVAVEQGTSFSPRIKVLLQDRKKK